MTWSKCNNCGGVFPDKQADGTISLHVCPPVTCARVTRGGADKLAPLDDLQPTDTIKVLRAGAVVETLVGAMLKDDVRQGDVAMPRSVKTIGTTPTADPTAALPPLTKGV